MDIDALMDADPAFARQASDEMPLTIELNLAADQLSAFLPNGRQVSEQLARDYLVIDPANSKHMRGYRMGLDGMSRALLDVLVGVGLELDVAGAFVSAVRVRAYLTGNAGA